MDKLYHRRHQDFEVFDEIRIKMIPRYKTSGLSGDEWRVSARVELCFKGEVVRIEHYGDMEAAIRYLNVIAHEVPIPNKVIELEKTHCDQVGCDQVAVAKYQFKELFSQNGHRLDPTDTTLKYYAKFCKKHLRRGDCGRGDADANYEVIEGPGPDSSTNVEESPSVFGGVVDLVHLEERK